MPSGAPRASCSTAAGAKRRTAASPPTRRSPRPCEPPRKPSGRRARRPRRGARPRPRCRPFGRKRRSRRRSCRSCSSARAHFPTRRHGRRQRSSGWRPPSRASRPILPANRGSTPTPARRLRGRRRKAGLGEGDTARAGLTEGVGRLAARHQAASRTATDAETTLEKAESATAEAADTARVAGDELAAAETALASAAGTVARTTAEAEAAEAALAEADEARGAAQAREAEGRAERSAAEGEVAGLEAEVASLARLVRRDTAEGGQVMDLVRIEPGFEKALGAALADDLRAPVIDEDGGTGWATLENYTDPQPLPAGTEPLAARTDVPAMLRRRLSQVGVVDADEGARLQAGLRPGQRLVSLE